MMGHDYKFIEEQIKPQKYRKWIKLTKKLGGMIVMGAVFGVTAAIALHVTDNMLGKSAKNDNGPVVSLPGETSEPSAEPTYEPQPTPVSEPSGDSANETENESGIIDNSALDMYSDMCGELAEYCEEYNNTIVTVARVDGDSDLFTGSVVNSSYSYGLIIQQDNDMLYILTDSDYIDTENQYRIIFGNDDSVKAEILGINRVAGLAVVSADVSALKEATKESIMIAKLGDSEKLNVGDMVVAIGKPMGSIYSMAYGFITSEPEIQCITDRSITMYNTDIYSVNDGKGIVMNTEGKVLGVISQRYDYNSRGCVSFIGISGLRKVIKQLMNDIECGSLGLIVNDVSDKYLDEIGISNGVYVFDVKTGSAAMKAGISVGDVIMCLNGELVNSVKDYTDMLSEIKPGSEVEIYIYRDYANKEKYKTVTATLDKVE